jgi:hypothetical protein
VVATVDQCRAAVLRLAERIATDKRAAGFDRTISAAVTDLGVVFHGRLRDGVLQEISTHRATDAVPAAQVRLELRGDDLLALASGRLSFVESWLTGRIHIQASLGDLLQLRKLL